MLFSIDRDTITTIANPACGCCKSSAKKAKCFIAITAQLNALGEAVFRLNDRETKRLHDIVIKSTEHFWELVSREVMYTQTGNRSKVRGFLRMAAQFQAAGVKAPPYIGLDAHSRLGKMTPRLKALRQLDGNPFTGRLDVHWDSKYVLESAVGQKFADELSQLGLARTLHAIAQCESGTLDLSADRAADGVLGTGLRPEDFWVTKKTLLEWSARYHGSRQREHWDAFNSEPSFERLAPHAPFWVDSATDNTISDSCPSRALVSRWAISEKRSAIFTTKSRRKSKSARPHATKRRRREESTRTR